MYRQKLTFLLLVMMMCGWHAEAENPRVLDPDSCRALAVRNNNELRGAAMEKERAAFTRRSAHTGYLPKVAATGLYMHTGKELSLLSDDQKSMLSGLGDVLGVPALNSAGQGLADALRTDTRNMAGAALILTQPLYMGGKIRAYNNIARYAESVAADKYELKYQDLLAEVDETYWSIVALAARKRLAESYLHLVQTLDGDIEAMIKAGLATRADGLSVKVKVNEAEVAIIQVDNGLELLKMKLCQLCGLPPESEITLADESYDSQEMPAALGDEYAGITPLRPELSALATAVRINEEKVNVARAEFLPSVVLTGGYFASYPSVFNSFEKKFKGTWSVGVAVNIPILTWGDRRYKVNAARAEAAAARFSLEEVREKIDLQVSQSRRRVTEAREKLKVSRSSQEAAEENLRHATLGMKEGALPVSNVIEAQTAWLSAKTTLINSEIDLRLAHVYLRKSLGIIK